MPSSALSSGISEKLRRMVLGTVFVAKHDLPDTEATRFSFNAWADWRSTAF